MPSRAGVASKQLVADAGIRAELEQRLSQFEVPLPSGLVQRRLPATPCSTRRWTSSVTPCLITQASSPTSMTIRRGRRAQPCRAAPANDISRAFSGEGEAEKLVMPGAPWATGAWMTPIALYPFQPFSVNVPSLSVP